MEYIYDKDYARHAYWKSDEVSYCDGIWMNLLQMLRSTTCWKIPNTIFRRLAPIFLKNGWIKSQYEINCKLAQTPRHIGAGPVDRTVTESSLSRWIRKPKSGFLEFWSLSYFQINFRFGFQNDKNILASLFWNHSTIFRNFQKGRFSIFLTIECFYI